MNFNRNDIKLSFERPVYSVNPKKGTVTCILNYAIVMPTGCTSASNKENGLRVFFGNDAWPECKAIGIAKCSPNDKFDEKVGMEVAEARAESIAYSQSNRKIETLFQNLAEQMYNWQSNFDTKSAKILAHNVEYIKTVGK